MITAEEYLKRPHIYLETKQGRRQVFAHIGRVLERGLREDRRNDFMYAISEIESFLTGKDPIFVKLDIPNVHRLRAERENIKREALVFFGKNLDLLKMAFFKTNNVMDRFDILFLLVKFMPQVQDIEIRQFTDLYLILFYTIRYISSFEGTEEEKNKLANLALKGFSRYDAKEAARFFILNPPYKKGLEEIEKKYKFYREYLMLLDKKIGLFLKKETTSLEVIIPSIFTDEIFSLLNWKYKGRLGDVFLEKKDKMETFVLERINVLFEGVKESVKKEMRHIIDGYLKEKEDKIKNDGYLKEKEDKIKNRFFELKKMGFSLRHSKILD